MNRILAPAIVAGILAVTSPAHAAGPWTVANPQGATYTSPGAGTVTVGIVTSDGYPTRVDVTQAFELVVVRVNGVEVGRTPDLPDRVASASVSSSFTFAVNPGDVVTIVHSSVVGLSDGTQNSVIPAITFGFAPTPTTTTTTTTTTLAPATTTTAPAVTTSSTVVPTTSAPPASTSSTVPTTTVEVGRPPVPPSTVATFPPRATTTTVSDEVPPLRLPDTGFARIVAAYALLFVAAGAIVLAINGRGGRRG